jgi:hypothetical protein
MAADENADERRNLLNTNGLHAEVNNEVETGLIGDLGYASKSETGPFLSKNNGLGVNHGGGNLVKKGILGCVGGWGEVYMRSIYTPPRATHRPSPGQKSKGKI